MDLGTVFKISLYGLTALVGAILGSAEGEGVSAIGMQNHFVLPFVSLPIVVFGYLLTEARLFGSRPTDRGLSSFWANILGLIALIATAQEFFSESREGKLLAGTHLLLYVTWIVLFQQKTPRLYWFLMALGILQLSVASVLTSKGWFGFCAIIYMFGAVWTLSIFSLWRAERLFAEETKKQQDERQSLIDQKHRGERSTELQSRVQSAVYHEGGTRWLTIRFVTGVLMTTCSALLVSAVFFIFIPRVWLGTDVSMSETGESTGKIEHKTGLATSVRLGYLGPVLESNDRVFEVQLFNQKTQQLMPVNTYAELLGMSEPLFRGAILLNYHHGYWGADELPGAPTRNFRTNDRALTDITVKQEIFLDPGAGNILYSLGSPLMIVDRRDQAFGEFNQSTGVSTRGEDGYGSNSLPYTVLTRLPVQQQSRYKLRATPNVRQFYQASRYLEKAKEVPRGLDAVDELTRQIISRETTRVSKAEQRETPRKLTPLEIAEAIEYHLLLSGEYQYSLDISIVDTRIDPIEDFLINRKKGHCEYFATAMALMLRTANIPARIVSGYKGGIERPNKQALEVQQRYAHMWVEAWVDNEGWTTFDATPQADRNASIVAMAAKQKSLWAGVQNTFSGLWSENVLNMSLDRQEASFYKPLRRVFYSTAKFLRELFTSPKQAILSFGKVLMNREKWFSIEGGLFAFLFMIFVVGTVWLTERLIRFIRTCIANRSLFGAVNRPRFVEFYERFQRLALAKGLRRAPQQTQGEFAEVVASAYSPELTAFGLIDFPKTISQLFYRVRFGDEALSSTELGAINDQMAKFELALSNESNRS